MYASIVLCMPVKKKSICEGEREFKNITVVTCDDAAQTTNVLCVLTRHYGIQTQSKAI